MKKRLMAFLLALCLFCAVGSELKPAHAKGFTVYVTASTQAVYRNANSGSQLLGTMAFGESMECIAYNDSWAAVKNASGAVGYCKIDGLSTHDPSNLNLTAYIKTDNLPVYRLPKTSSRVMMKVKKGAQYKCVGVTADKKWARLQNGKYFGFVETKYLSTEPMEQQVDQTVLGEVYIQSNTLRVYDKPATSGKSLGLMSYGEALDCLAVSGDWARVRNSSGAIGYCKRSGLTSTNPNKFSDTIAINADKVKVYRKPTTDAGVMMLLNKGAKYTLIAKTNDGKWARLKNGKYYGYVQMKYISQEEEPETIKGEPYFVVDDILTIDAFEDEGSHALATLGFGEGISLIEVSDGRAHVQLSDGRLGYCSYGGLQRSNPNTLRKPYYAIEESTQLYALPMDSASITQILPINTSVMVVALSSSGDWARVLLDSGAYAYVPMTSLSLERAAVDHSIIEDITPRPAYIIALNLDFYTLNDSESRVLGTLSFGEELSCTGLGGGWARVVNAKGNVGYCEQKSLSFTDPNTYSKTLYAQRKDVKVYASASTGAKVLSSLALNDSVVGVNISPDQSWVRIRTNSGYGYVQAAMLATTPVKDPAVSGQIQDLLALANAQINIRYVYAAQSPSTGFDCSGFTYYVFKNAVGISLKRTAYTQGYDSRYQKIGRIADLKVGDLVFFNTVEDGADDLCDHVGIYLGGNRFIHASSGAGKVTISSLGTSSSNYYDRVWSWGRRVL